MGKSIFSPLAHLFRGFVDTFGFMIGNEERGVRELRHVCGVD